MSFGSRRIPVSEGRSSRWQLVFAIVLGISGFTFFALDGLMYWHEARLLYAVSHFSITDLIAGAFNPNQLGGEANIAASAGYHLSKFLYLQSLYSLTRLPVTPDQQLLIGSLASLTLVCACGFCMRRIMSNLGATPGAATLSIIAFFLMPSAPYLAGKLLAEATALLPSCLGLWLWSGALGTPRPKNWLRLTGVSMLILLTALLRLDVTIVFFGFAVATVVVPAGHSRLRLLLMHGAVLSCAAALYLLCLVLIEGSPSSLLAYLMGYLSLEPKSMLMTAFGIVSFAGFMWIIATIGAISAGNFSIFLVIWLAASLVPIIAITTNYMVEPRYLISGMIPLAGLAGVGLERCRNSFPILSSRKFSLIALATIAFLNWILVPFQPYEIDRKAILRATDSVPADAVLLVPWSYTDFHFLRFARPDNSVYNVHSPAWADQGLSVLWDQRLTDWYGDLYLPNAEALNSMEPQAARYYLGWGAYPPVETVLAVANRFTRPISGKSFTADSFMQHREQSWLWNSPDYKLESASRFGQYELYRVSLKKPEAEATRP